MTKNGAIGIAAVAALAAILYFGHKRPPDIVPLPIPRPTFTFDVPPVKAPSVTPPTVVKPPVTKPAPTKKPGKSNPNPVIYHRVEQDGTRGSEVACTSVKPFAEDKTPAELAALAKQYGVSAAEVQRWFICVQ